MPSRGPPRCGISGNAYQICHHESNHCYQPLGHNTPFSGRGTRNSAEDGPRHNILQLNTEGLNPNKISVIEQYHCNVRTDHYHEDCTQRPHCKQYHDDANKRQVRSKGKQDHNRNACKHTFQTQKRVRLGIQ